MEFDFGTHDRVALVATGASQMPVRPIEEAVTKRFSVGGRRRQPIDHARLSRLARQTLFEHVFATILWLLCFDYSNMHEILSG